MKNRNLKHSDNWATPKAFYNELDKEFHFDFDPCPLNESEITPEKDGLLIEWGQRNFINPPYSRMLKEAFVKKAIEQTGGGKLCVMLLPVSTSTAIFHDYIKPNASEIRFIRGRLKFSGYNSKGEPVNMPVEGSLKNQGMHDSMIVVFLPTHLGGRG